MVQVFNVSRGATAARSPWRRLWQRACIGAVLCAAAGGAWAQSADLVLSNHVVSPDPVPAGGIATITMTVQATLPLLGLWGVPYGMEISAHAPAETLDR